ncbi:MAG: hypothetical protein AB4042_08915 [Leptolyngbyaceae cyanobacterium]
MLSQEPNLAKQAESWNFLELWIDPILFPPKILMVVGDEDGSCRIFNPASGYNLIIAHPNYQAAKDWLLEDDYERVDGQLLAADMI